MVIRSRWIRIYFYLACLFFLMIYGKIYNPTVTLTMCLQNPAKYDGSLVSIGSEVKVVDVTDEWFTIQQLGVVMKVFGAAPEIKPDEFIIVETVFHREGWLELRRVYVAVQRRYKILISVVPVILIFTLFLFVYRFDFHKLEFVERRVWRI